MMTPGDERNNNYLTNAIDDLKNIWNTMIDLFTKMDLDEMVHLYSKKIDTEILKTIKETGWAYRGGQLTVTYVTNQTFSLKIALYYQDEKDEWMQVQAVTPRDIKYLKDDAVKELFEKKKISYDIDTPTLEKSKEQDAPLR
ncbi:hypothetical protein [uncultured Selenomonas sp.]|uniref:hypothetical protein n=1 Tax=uncultured Selenomonas sp. TaxID=159275 RepID=UPI0028DC73E3|nr:hypothetical protein [uncultured Selenomonas sp.]